jgi:hypothetical protein
VVVHTSEGSTDQLGLAAYLANPSNQVSYHCVYDNKGDPNIIVECVRRNNKSWSAMQANDWGVHGCCCTPNGASAGWSRNDWLAHPTMLEKCKRWIAEECAFYGIPMVKVNANDISAGRLGVCGHGDCSAAGAGGSHFDPGNNFPWDVVLGGTPSEEDDLTPEEHQMLVDISHNVAGTGPMNQYQNELLIDIQTRCKDIQANVAGTGPMNEFQNQQLAAILEDTNKLVDSL